MPYLCKNQSILVLSILFKLWDRVLNEKVFDFKVCNLFAYLTFVENIPFGFSSDALFCNYLLTSFTSAIKNSTNKKDIYIFVKSLHRIILKIMDYSPKCLENVEKSKISKAVSVLNTKTEEGYGDQCNTVLKYLTNDINFHIDGSIDAVDCVDLMTNDGIEKKVTKSVFLNRLKEFALNLPNARCVVLCKGVRKLSDLYIK